jgi:hypothetical protein
MRASYIPIAVLALLCVGCSQTASPISPTLGSVEGSMNTAPTRVGGGKIASATEVPLKGTLEGASTMEFDPPPSPFFSVHLRATGNATHLGRFTLDAPHRVNGTTLTSVGTGLFTAANGDRLMTDFTGVATPLSAPGTFAIRETFIIKGGTGRFDGATGTFVLERVVDLADPATSGSFEGTMSWARDN